MAILNGSYQEFTLDNGLVVALQKTPSQTISGRLRVWHGGLHELSGEEGIAHLLEHLIVTGGCESYSPSESVRTFCSFGSSNAVTDLDRTSSIADMLPESLDLFLDYFSHLVTNPSLDATTLSQEKGRVLREIADSRSSAQFSDSLIFNEAVYGKGSPFIYDLLGSDHVVASATAATLDSFFRRGYSPNNMDLVLVGALPDDIADAVERVFGNLKRGPGNKFVFPKPFEIKGRHLLHSYAPDLCISEDPNKSTAFLQIACNAPSDDEPDSSAMIILDYILGRGVLNSRLHQSVSQLAGMAYVISSQYSTKNNIGRLNAYGKIHASRKEEAISAVFDVMARLRDEQVLQEQVDYVKGIARFTVASTLDSNPGHACAIQNKLDTGRTPDSFLDCISRVTSQDVQEAARKYLPESIDKGDYVLLLRDPLKKQ